MIKPKCCVVGIPSTIEKPARPVPKFKQSDSLLSRLEKYSLVDDILFAMMLPNFHRIQKLQDIASIDAGNLGMKSFIVPCDSLQASRNFASSNGGAVVLLGFPCCVKETPRTETDGPPGAVALVPVSVALEYDPVTLVPDACNRSVVAAAWKESDFHPVSQNRLE
jgi:hypothetical protein